MTSLHGYYVDRGGDVHEADVYAFENIWKIGRAHV